MEIRAAHHFSQDVDAVWAMFLDPEAHVAKYQHMKHRDVEVLSAEGDDHGLSISIVRQVDIEVPSLAKKFINPSNTVTSTDRWELDKEGVRTGRSTVEIKGVPVHSTAIATLEPSEGGGCDYTIVLTMKVKVPVIGEKVANVLRPQLEEQLAAEFAASEAWLAR
jgi:hypothetical protein